MSKFLKATSMVASFLITTSALACSGFLPENDMYIPANMKGMKAGLSEAQFNSAIDKVVSVYSPIVARMGANFLVERKWTDGTVNAYATREGKSWTIAMFGGLARHPAITQDGMSLVVCHELGHHIGGAPKKVKSANKWSGAEGQADYFAALKCMRKVFLNDNNLAIVASMTVPKVLADACKSAYKNDLEDSALCIRMSMAGKSVADMFTQIDPRLPPATKFDTPDKSKVVELFESHPQAQCRLDTFFQGSMCDVNMNEDVSQTDEVKGTCHSSLGYKFGTRPLCWFKTNIK